MASVDNIGELMSELGPLLEPEQIVSGDNGRLYRIALNAEMFVDVTADASRECLVFEGSLGTPPPAAASSIHRLLMQTTHLWERTGGIRFGLRGAEGQVSMLWDCPLGTLDVPALASALGQFAERMLIWQQVVTTGLLEPSDGSNLRAASPITTTNWA